MPRLTRPCARNKSAITGSRRPTYVDVSKGNRCANWMLEATKISDLSFFRRFYLKYCKYLEYYSLDNMDGTYNAYAYIQLPSILNSSTLSSKLNCRISAKPTTIEAKLQSEFHQVPHKISFGKESTRVSLGPHPKDNPSFVEVPTTVVVKLEVVAKVPASACWLPQAPKPEDIKIKLFH